MANSDPGDVLLAGEGLCCDAGGKRLVADASLSLAAGRVTVLVGPNGAGKSTLLKLLTGEITPSRGTVRLCGEALGAVPAWQLAARRAVMAQQSRLAFPFSVFEVARLGVDGIGRGLSRARRDAIVAECLARAGVLQLAARSYQTLSGGEQQRVQFARALLLKPRWLYLDEATSALDAASETKLLAALRTALPDTAVFSIGHRPALQAFHRRHAMLDNPPQGAARLIAV